MENKKGQMTSVVVLILGLILLVFIIAGLTIGWGVVKSATDVIIPEFTSIGEIFPGSNVSEYAEMTLNPASSIIDNMGLIIGLVYILGLVGLLGYAFIFRNNFNGWIAMFFIASVLMLIMLSIFVSQYYESFYLDQNELGTILRSATLVSFLIIQSPVILTIIAFIAGIILFTGNREDSFNV